MDALSRRRNSDPALGTASSGLFVGDDDGTRRRAVFCEAAGVVHGGRGLDEVVDVVAELGGREERTHLVDVEALILREEVVVGHAARLVS